MVCLKLGYGISRHDTIRTITFKGAIDDILNINIAANNYWLCKDIVE